MGGIWKHRKWLMMAAAVAAVVFVAYAKRLTLERLAIAGRLYRAQIFTPPTGGAFDSRWARVREEAQFYWDFAGFSSFKVRDLDDTVGDAYFYGVLFLRETGYFQREKRFWTDQEFPEAKKVREQIRSKIESVGVDELELKEAYEALGPAQ